ncbi:hypothetical protein NPIL_488591 [Nephila pilipes]|uniref:Uncharacterized protein n=1 Tax=Nephila pilipes TaxID=299642 RepID=A0A8X6NV15_NEPPI|nr:hypothetical protein NPIL_488591 [Nephila pilipes]
MSLTVARISAEVSHLSETDSCITWRLSLGFILLLGPVSDLRVLKTLLFHCANNSCPVMTPRPVILEISRYEAPILDGQKFCTILNQIMFTQYLHM